MIHAVTRHHLVRIGALGHVGRFTSVDAIGYERGHRVICRTARGLEVGEVLSPDPESPGFGESDGSILRAVAAEDELLIERLEQNKLQAYDACVRRLAELGLDAVLLDVEHLFDGQSLFFYFLGEVPPEVEAVTDELAEAYEAQAQFRRFSETMIAGCGPDCGTEAAAGCGTSCGSCAIAGACGAG